MKKLLLLLTTLSSFCSESIYLSFIVPCYNRQHTLQETIDSIYAQQLPFAFEVVCVDDGSTDGTYAFLKQCEKRYHNFRVFRHTNNKGASEARNTCVKHACGQLIFSLDSDNVLVTNSVIALVNYMTQMECEAAAFEETRHFKGRRQHVYSDRYKHINGIFDLSCMFKSSKSPGASGNYLYTKESFYRAGGYSGEGCETWVFCFKQLVTGTRFAILPGYYWHRISDDSYWRRLEAKGLNDKNCLTVVKQFLQVFTHKTQRLLKTYDLNKSRFFYDLNHGKFQVRPLEELKELFRAYALEQLDRGISHT